MALPLFALENVRERFWEQLLERLAHELHEDALVEGLGLDRLVPAVRPVALVRFHDRLEPVRVRTPAPQ